VDRRKLSELAQRKAGRRAARWLKQLSDRREYRIILRREAAWRPSPRPLTAACHLSGRGTRLNELYVVGVPRRINMADIFLAAYIIA
jgi:hypothetical protein